MVRASPRKKAAVNYSESADDSRSSSSKAAPIKKLAEKVKAKVTGKRKAESDPEPEPETNGIAATSKAVKKEDEDNTGAAKPAKKRKTKAKEEGDGMPLAERTAVTSLKKTMYIGAHVSAAGGVNNAVTNAVHIGANSFALFLKSQRKWANPPMTTEAKDLFISNCGKHGYSAGEHALPHGSYLVNLAQADKEKAEQAYGAFVDDLKRCDTLGIRLYNFHPGSTGGEPRPAAIGRIAAQLNRSHKETKSVVTVLENMAGSGNVIGSTFEDLRDIIALVEDKSRVGVCIDTCHAFAAGYDLRSPEAFRKTFDSFDKIVGNSYLRAFHLNDSKAPFSSHRDLHANIGTGFLGLRAFHNVMNEDNFRGMPMVLETPIDKKGPDGKSVEDKQVWADEIKLLESLIGMDADTPEFAELEKTLQAKGQGERGRVQEQVDKKAIKDAKKGAGGKKKKKAADSDDDSD